MKKIPYFLAGALALTLPSLAAFAATTSSVTTPATEQICALQASVNKLAILKDAAGASNKELELDAYTELLRNILHCSLLEIRNFRTKLDALDDLKGKDAALRESFTKKLEEYAEYHENATDVLEHAVTRDGQRELAAKILSWRKERYNDTAKDIANFIFIFQGRDAIATAEARLKKITAALSGSGITLTKETWKDLDTLLDKAQVNITAAKSMNMRAYGLLQERLDPDTTMSATAQIGGKTQQTIPDLLRSSLMKIKESYDIFGKIGASLKKALS